MFRPSTRLAAGALVLALPLAAAAGCGADKKRSIKAEFASAQSNLEKSKSASFTLRLDDTKGKLEAAAKKDDDAPPKEILDALLKGSITLTIDPTGARTLADLNAGSCPKPGETPDLAAEIKKVNLSIVVRDATSALGELRLVDGVLYAHVDLEEIGSLAEAGGVQDFDSAVDDAVTGANPKFAPALTDVRAGKWLKLPLAKYLEGFQELAESFSGAEPSSDPSRSCEQAKEVSGDLYTAVKPYVTVTDANDDSDNRVLDVNVKVRPALKAALEVVKAAEDLPFGALLAGLDATTIDDNVADGTGHGTITLKDGHLNKLALDIESIRKLDPEPGTTDLSGSFVVVEVDDNADELETPDDVSSFDLAALVDDFFDQLSQASGAEG